VFSRGRGGTLYTAKELSKNLSKIMNLQYLKIMGRITQLYEQTYSQTHVLEKIFSSKIG
jgi:hypothetical protein